MGRGHGHGSIQPHEEYEGDDAHLLRWGREDQNTRDEPRHGVWERRATLQDIDTHNKIKKNQSTAQKKRGRNEYESQTK